MEKEKQIAEEIVEVVDKGYAYIKMTPDEKQLAIARFQSMSNNIRLSVGFGGFNGGRKECIKEIENETEIGEFLVEVEMNYLRSFKDSKIWKKTSV